MAETPVTLFPADGSDPLEVAPSAVVLLRPARRDDQCEIVILHGEATALQKILIAGCYRDLVQALFAGHDIDVAFFDNRLTYRAA